MSNIPMGYINNKGEFFENIRNIKISKTLPYQFGTFYAENKKYGDPFKFSDDDLDGVYIYKSFYDKKKALRIYKDFVNYPIICHDDDAKLVSELQKRQIGVKLTELPTGIVTIENKVIGQEIPLYEDHVDISDYFKNKSLRKTPTSYYIEILKILKELYNNGIIYSDVHGRNFLVSKIEDTIKLIDFEKHRIDFDESKSCNKYKDMINNLKGLLNILNEFYNIEFRDNFTKTETLEEIDEYIKEKDLELKKK